MTLSAEQLDHRHQIEQSYDRLRWLKRANSTELRRLLGGDPRDAAFWLRQAVESDETIAGEIHRRPHLATLLHRSR